MVLLLVQVARVKQTARIDPAKLAAMKKKEREKKKAAERKKEEEKRKAAALAEEAKKRKLAELAAEEEDEEDDEEYQPSDSKESDDESDDSEEEKHPKVTAKVPLYFRSTFIVYYRRHMISPQMRSILFSTLQRLRLHRHRHQRSRQLRRRSDRHPRVFLLKYYFLLPVDIEKNIKAGLESYQKKRFD